MRGTSRLDLHYTVAMTVELSQIDWKPFLARPMLAAPTARTLERVGAGTVLITGAGGSIGSALARQLARLIAQHSPPERIPPEPVLPQLILLDASESHLYHLQQDLAADAQPTMRIRYALANCADRAALEELFILYRPQLVFHTAAYKHVPLLEEMPLAAVANNVLATGVLADVAARYHARMILLSTDKAASPTSIMGATKWLAEQIALRAGGTALRLANVLASSGSVVERFAAQIVAGQPLTITSPQARRYFLTAGEAVHLLLSAATVPAPSLLAPELASDHAIPDLARFLASTLNPEMDVSMTWTGLRAGEKLTERLWSTAEQARPIGSGLLAIIAPLLAPSRLDRSLRQLHRAVATRDGALTVGELKAIVPGFDASQTAAHSHEQAIAQEIA